MSEKKVQLQCNSHTLLESDEQSEVDLLIQKGNKLVFDNNYHEAIEVFTRAIALNPSNPFVYDMRASGMYLKSVLFAKFAIS